MSDDILSNLLSTLSVRVHAIALCQIQRGWRLAKTGAADAIYIHYVLIGKGTVAVGDQAPVPFGPNTMIIPPRHTAHTLGFPDATRTAAAADAMGALPNGLITLTAGDGSRDILIACGSITADYADSIGLFDRLREALVEDLSGSDRLRHAFAFMAEELAQPGLGTQEVTAALMRQSLIIMLRVHLREQGTRSPLFDALRDPRLVRAVVAILDAPNAAHTVDSLAALCGMSRSVFAQTFSSTFGEGAIAFLQRVRLRLGTQLLTASPMPVKVIAESVGYASRSHFSRAFKAAYGVDPSAYRARRAKRAATSELPLDATESPGERDGER
ncbi:AraC family transcriptional regulator [Methylobacterium sp. 391_Methyba4]|uniref:helix-turn-helix transcriptional regulator n=1 Tax=Methylobacterium sp. 391_Methyba4 TaxID=3038924 RepID=UPI00241FE7C6|nr:AraC family transcriptional regulator [Methylobacterium sp. 391_Methyba4]WFS09674.1 AraC family transcriptional regulator [Methylobacterium sp. 391_Methyba4]